MDTIKHMKENEMDFMHYSTMNKIISRARALIMSLRNIEEGALEFL
jgi:hypothetical protein